MSGFDPRLLRVSIEIGKDIRVYTDVQISVSATKFANAIQNDATVKITNMRKDARDFILTETTPFNLFRIRKRIKVEAGRASTGYFLIYAGDIVTATPSQPPDIQLTFTCKSNQWDKGNMVSKSMAAQSPLSRVAQQVADSMGLTLVFEAKEKNIGNYSFTGASLRQVDKLGQVGLVNAYVDDNNLVVKDFNAPLKGVSHVLSAESGMIGIPSIDEQGVKATMLLNSTVKLGGSLQIKSVLNPTANGNYCIYKLTYELSNRDDPFYVIAEGKRFGTFI